jgi:hypothetical protein
MRSKHEAYGGEENQLATAMDPLDLGSTVAADHDVLWKSDRVFRFFSSGGLYR